MFYNCNSLETVSLNIDTSEVTQMDYMFYNSYKLTSLDISKFNFENLIDSSHMFHGCSRLEKIKFNDNTSTKNLEDMNSMFYECKSLVEMNTKIFKQNKLTNLSYAFKDCNSLKSIDLSDFKSQNITELRGTFLNCYSLANINFTNFNI